MLPAAAKAAASIDVPGLILSLARELPAADVDNPAIAQSIIKTAAFNRRMLDGAGGALSARQLREVLGHKIVQAVYKAVKERRLLMVDEDGARLFPALQYDGASERPAIPRLLAAAPNASGWAILQYLGSGDDGLDGARPIDLIKGDDADVERLVRLARPLED